MSELDELGREYAAGRLDAVVRDLASFIERNREDILRFREAKARRFPLMTDELAVKLYLQQLRTLNPVAEIREQLEEIRRECYYRGVDSGRPASQEDVAREWCARHAPGWRDHRVTTIVFCFERNKERLLPLLRR